MTDKNNSQTLELPEFSSLEEEATFWETHHALKYHDPAAPIYVSPGGNTAKPSYRNKRLESSMYIRFSDKDLEEIRGLADEKGLGATTLVRMWALEKLKEEKRERKDLG